MYCKIIKHLLNGESVREDWQSSLFAKEFCIAIKLWFCLHNPGLILVCCPALRPECFIVLRKAGFRDSSVH